MKTFSCFFFILESCCRCQTKTKYKFPPVYWLEGKIMIKPDLIYFLFLFCLVANNGRVFGKEITSRNISKRYGKKLIVFSFILTKFQLPIIRKIRNLSEIFKFLKKSLKSILSLKEND
jgi:hypothetical protein